MGWFIALDFFDKSKNNVSSKKINANDNIIGPRPDTKTIFRGDNPAERKKTKLPCWLNIDSAINVPISIELSRYCIPLCNCS